MYRQFIEMTLFSKAWDALGLNDDDLNLLEHQLLTNPNAGAIMPGCGGARKIRFALPGSSKSGGARVIYVDFVVRGQIYLLLAYPKSKQASLSAEQKQNLSRLVKSLGGIAVSNNDFFEDFNLYDSLKQSLEDAIAFKNGDKSKARVRTFSTASPVNVMPYKPADVAKLRRSLNLSQRNFATAIGVSPRTVEAWEAGKSIPNGVATRMLYLIENDNSLVDRLVIR